MARPRGSTKTRSWKQSDEIRALVREAARVLGVSVSAFADTREGRPALPVSWRGKKGADPLRRLQNLMAGNDEGGRPLSDDGALDLLDVVTVAFVAAAFAVGRRSRIVAQLRPLSLEADAHRQRIVGGHKVAALLVAPGQGALAAASIARRLRSRLPSVRGRTLRVIEEEISRFFSDYEDVAERANGRDILRTIRYDYNDRDLSVLKPWPEHADSALKAVPERPDAALAWAAAYL